MKKFVALLLTFALLLALAACGGGDTPGESTDPNQSSADPGKQATENTETQPQEIQDTPFGQYLSEEEILAMLESGDMTYWMSADPEMPADSVDTGGDEPYSGFSNSIIFTDGGDGEGVEFVDIMEQLSPEERAEWEEMEKSMTDPEMLEMAESLTGIDGEAEEAPETQVPQIDMSELELPEGYEDYLPEGFDMEALLGG